MSKEYSQLKSRIRYYKLQNMKLEKMLNKTDDRMYLEKLKANDKIIRDLRIEQEKLLKA